MPLRFLLSLRYLRACNVACLAVVGIVLAALPVCSSVSCGQQYWLLAVFGQTHVCAFFWDSFWVSRSRCRRTRAKTSPFCMKSSVYTVRRHKNLVLRFEQFQHQIERAQGLPGGCQRGQACYLRSSRSRFET